MQRIEHPLRCEEIDDDSLRDGHTKRLRIQVKIKNQFLWRPRRTTKVVIAGNHLRVVHLSVLVDVVATLAEQPAYRYDFADIFPI